MFRFDSRKGAYLYPVGSGESGRLIEYRLLRGLRALGTRSSDREPPVSVIKLGLRIPAASDFGEFANEISRAEEEFADRISSM